MTTMTEDDKKELGQALLSQMQDIQTKLDALGIVKEKENEHVKVAPDGGPLSRAHKFLKAQLEQTINVKFKLTGTRAIINKRDFNPDVHERVKKRKKTQVMSQPTSSSKEDIPSVKLGDQTKDQLLTMTVPALNQLPEVSLMDDPPKDKAVLVDAILKLRKRLA